MSDSSSTIEFVPRAKAHPRRRVIVESSNSSSSEDEGSSAKPLRTKRSSRCSGVIGAPPRKDANFLHATAQKDLLDSDSSFEDLLKSLQIGNKSEPRHTGVKVAYGTNASNENEGPDSDDDSFDESSSESDLSASQRRSDSVNVGKKKIGKRCNRGSDSFIVKNSESDKDSLSDSDESDVAIVDGADGNVESDSGILNSSWKLDTNRNEFHLKNDSNASTNRWPNFRLPASLFKKLFDYQVGGVEFLASLHENGIGGVLGDDMGMVSTSVCAFLLITFVPTQTCSCYFWDAGEDFHDCCLPRWPVASSFNTKFSDCSSPFCTSFMEKRSRKGFVSLRVARSYSNHI